MRLIFVRHGLTDTNVRGLAGEAIVEDDAPLNAEGLAQAKEVARQLKDEQVDAIFVSPYQRAKQTAAEIAQYHKDVPVVEMEGLRERQGGTLVGESFHDLFDFEKDIHGEGIEPVREFFQRVYDTIDRIRNSGYQNVLVVSHGGVFHAVRAYYLGLEWKGNLRIERLGNCDFRIYKMEEKK